MSVALSEEPTPAQRWFSLAEQDIAAARILIADGSAALPERQAWIISKKDPAAGPWHLIG